MCTDSADRIKKVAPPLRELVKKYEEGTYIKITCMCIRIAAILYIGRADSIQVFMRL